MFSELAEHVDDMAIIRSMHTDIPAHEVATVMMNTGSLPMAQAQCRRVGAYGLGSANQNMPGFISLRNGGGLPPGGSLNWGSAFLPGDLSGHQHQHVGRPVTAMIQNIRNPYFRTTNSAANSTWCSS